MRSPNKSTANVFPSFIKLFLKTWSSAMILGLYFTTSFSNSAFRCPKYFLTAAFTFSHNSLIPFSSSNSDSTLISISCGSSSEYSPPPDIIILMRSPNKSTANVFPSFIKLFLKTWSSAMILGLYFTTSFSNSAFRSSINALTIALNNFHISLIPLSSPNSNSGFSITFGSSSE